MIFLLPLLYLGLLCFGLLIMRMAGQERLCGWKKLAAACAAWVKQEGIVFFVLMCGCACGFHWRKPLGHLIWSLALGFVFVLPWRLYAKIAGANDSDFDFSQPHDMEKTLKAWERVREAAIVDFQHHSGAFLMLPLLVLLGIWIKDIKAVMSALIGLAMIGIYLVVMGWSKVEMNWHLGATERYLMTPSLCVLLGMAALHIRDGKTFTPSRNAKLE